MRDKLRHFAKKNRINAFFVISLVYIVIKFKPEKEERLFSSIEKNVEKEKLNDKSYKRKLIKDMIRCFYVNGFMYDEYFAFDLGNKTESQRYEYVGTLERYDLLTSLSSKETQEIFDDKFKCYNTFKKYYDRKIIKLTKESYEDFIRFTDEVSEFVVKPYHSSLGRGVYPVYLDECDKTKKELFNEIISKESCILEEPIYQSFSMAMYHPASVNTIRFVTYYNNGKMMPIYALFRMGIGDSFVDNAFTGGIIASIDVETGIVKTSGYRNIKGKKETFDVHPETMVKIKGAKIERWNELINQLQEMVTIVPEQKLVGWDMALTDNGWVMVEGNSRPIFKSIQLCEGKGFRDIFKEIN